MPGKGDFSRSTFNRSRHYTSVRMQQGRVMLDAEANEQADIGNYLRETVSRDVIGRTGAPRDDAGFRIGVIPGDLLISAGRFYVDGILCECEGTWGAVASTAGTPITTIVLKAPWVGTDFVNGAWVQLDGLHTNGSPRTEFVQLTGVNAGARQLTVAPLAQMSAVHFVRSTIRYSQQPDAPVPVPAIPAGDYLAYLHVWNRHITTIEDPLIRETALGIPDTTTRDKAAWQVALSSPVQECKTFPSLATPGLMAARTVPPQTASNPCEIPRSAGYRRLENQLYRVEIHTGGAFAAARFKWSRDNGSVVFPIDAFLPNPTNPALPHNQVRIRSYGLDDRLSLHVNDWVEIIDDNAEVKLTPGQMRQVTTPPQSADPVVTLSANVNPADFPRNPRLRVWMRSDAALGEGANAAGYVALEDGIEVKFSTTGTYITGEHWLIPARTAVSQETGSIEWPVSGGNPVSLPAHGIERHFAALAEVRATGVEDCRPIFSPLSTPDLFYAGGDGQEVMPHATNGAQLVSLPFELRAGVSNGRAVKGAIVEFTLLNPGPGELSTSTIAPARKIQVLTNDEGIAACKWAVNSTDLTQRVQARLVDIEQPGYVPGVPSIIYSAILSTARNVTYHPGNCAFLSGVTTVQDALDELCKRPSGGGTCTLVFSPGDNINARLAAEAKAVLDLELCFKTGEFETNLPIKIEKRRSVKMTGGGFGSHIINRKHPTAVHFVGCDSVLVRDLFIEGTQGGGITANSSQQGAILFEECTVDVTAEQLRLQCAAGTQGARYAGLVARDCPQVRVSGCTVIAGPDAFGMHFTDFKRLVVTENRIAAEEQDIVVHHVALAKASLLKNLRVGPPPVVDTNEIAVKIGNQEVIFAVANPNIGDQMRRAIGAMPQTPVTTPRAALQFANDTAERLVRDNGFRSQFGLIAEMIQQLAPIAGRGNIGIYGLSNEGTVLITGNGVRHFWIGVRLDARVLTGAERYERIVISENDIRISTGPEEQSPFGILVRDTDSLEIFANLVTANFPRNGSDGIRAAGPLRRHAIIRDNHVTQFVNGIVSTAAVPTDLKQWRLSSNLVVGTPAGGNAYNAPGFDLDANKP
ncbi:MAG TPA: DUF6519 domain-containing protein [Thermoanaerobaculia bacterium]|nr:DUF6519 domain-containing protein [Thermoanaerobaculia bacterium]